MAGNAPDTVNRSRIYLDHAATTPIHPQVWDAMAEIHATGFGNPSSIHAEGRLARTIIEDARKVVARHLGASLSELFFTSCGTESNNMILLGAVRDLGVRRIISSPIEHHCVLHMLEHLKIHHSIDVKLLPVNKQGQIDLEDLKKALAQSGNEKTLVSLMHVNNELGTILDLQETGELCHAHGALFHSDTVQSIGFHRFQLEEMPLDFMSGSAHKFYGPKGVGFVYIRSGHALNPLLHGGSQERNMRSGTENILGIHGMAKAISLAEEDLPHRLDKLRSLRIHMREKLQSQLPGITFNEAETSLQSPKILSVNFPAGLRMNMLLMHLDIAGISASGGSACSSGVEMASHVLAQLSLPSDSHTVRFSFSPQNTEAELDHTLEILNGLYHKDYPSK